MRLKLLVPSVLRKTCMQYLEWPVSVYSMCAAAKI